MQHLRAVPWREALLQLSIRSFPACELSFFATTLSLLCPTTGIDSSAAVECHNLREAFTMVIIDIITLPTY